jgi:hypothetical protein
LDEFYRVAFRKKIYNALDELQADLDTWIKYYNDERVHSRKYCFGKTPMQTFEDSIPLVKEKMLNHNLQTETVAVSASVLSTTAKSYCLCQLFPNRRVFG